MTTSTTVPPQIPKTEPKIAPLAPQSPVSTASAKPTLQDLLEKFVDVQPLTNQSHFKYEGKCTKCGWHTLQLSLAAALTLVRQHVQQHWSDVAGQL